MGYHGRAVVGLTPICMYIYIYIYVYKIYIEGLLGIIKLRSCVQVAMGHDGRAIPISIYTYIYMYIYIYICVCVYKCI